MQRHQADAEQALLGRAEGLDLLLGEVRDLEVHERVAADGGPEVSAGRVGVAGADLERAQVLVRDDPLGLRDGKRRGRGDDLLEQGAGASGLEVLVAQLRLMQLLLGLRAKLRRPDDQGAADAERQARKFH